MTSKLKIVSTNICFCEDIVFITGIIFSETEHSETAE